MGQCPKIVKTALKAKNHYRIQGILGQFNGIYLGLVSKTGNTGLFLHPITKPVNIKQSALVLGLFLLVMSSCNSIRCVRGGGIKESQERNAVAFTGVHLQFDGHVNVSQGNRSEVIIIAPPHIQPLIKTEIIDGELVISSTRCLLEAAKDVDIFVTLPRLTHLKIKGDGQINGLNKFTSADLDVEITGGGKIKLLAEMSSVEIKVNGSGLVNLSGKAESNYMEVKGSGKLQLFELNSDFTYIDVDGPANIEVYTRNNLNIRANGNGEILYKGKPSVEHRYLGNARVVQVN